MEVLSFCAGYTAVLVTFILWKVLHLNGAQPQEEE